MVAPLVPVVKPQSAFFEACGPAGHGGAAAVLRRAREQGLLTILDGKRNDIASTATAYADAAFGGVTIGGQHSPVWDADALTVNPYLGRDAVEPFLHSARAAGRGVFVLVRTSNPGAGLFQDLRCDGQPLYLHVARGRRRLGRARTSGRAASATSARSSGATYRRSCALLRQSAGGGVPGARLRRPGRHRRRLRPAFRADGLGAVVNSSRGIILRLPAGGARLGNGGRESHPGHGGSSRRRNANGPTHPPLSDLPQSRAECSRRQNHTNRCFRMKQTLNFWARPAEVPGRRGAGG